MPHTVLNLIEQRRMKNKILKHTQFYGKGRQFMYRHYENP